MVSVIALAACSPIRIINQLSPSGHYELASDIAYGDSDRQSLDIYTPRSATGKAPLVIFFYGGGWRDGRKENYEFVASSLTEAGYAVIIPDYRLYPDVSFPTFVEDGALAVDWAAENAGEHGIDPDRLFLMGHSAGAHIAALLSLDDHYLAKHGIETASIRGLVGLSGPYDFLPIESGYLLDVFPENSRGSSQPIDFASAAAPPTLLIHGSDDDVVEPANSENLAGQLAKYGIDVRMKLYEGAGHATIVAALAPALDFIGDTLEDSRTFLDGLTAPQEN